VRAKEEGTDEAALGVVEKEKVTAGAPVGVD
jgi:hypothetical protein